MGDSLASLPRENFVRGLTGTTGMGVPGLGLLDLTPLGGAFGLQEAHREGDRQGMVLAVTPFGPGARAVKGWRRAPEIGKYAKYAENYPPVGEPRLHDNVTGKEVQFASRAEADVLVAQGKARWRKNLPPETQEFGKDRRAVQHEMDQKGYVGFFNPAERADVDPRNYPGRRDISVEAWPKSPEGQQKYRDLYVTEGANQRLGTGYKEGMKIDDSRGMLALKQIEDSYVASFGPELGRHLFRMELAGPIAATTAGLPPKQNLLTAHYLTREHKAGRRLPKHGYEMPYPIGGPFLASNSRAAQAFFDEGTGTFSASSPKSHEYLYGMLGHPDGHIVDLRASRAIVPGMRAPRYYGPAAEAMSVAQKSVGAPDARAFGDATWVGLGRPVTMRDR
jgi:hypothetical protein